MHKENLKKVKKYLFFISVLFMVLIGAHLFYIYLYEEDVKQTPIKGGVVSEGIYGKEYFKYKFNPLTFGKNTKHDYIMSFLYRSLLTYDAKKGEIVGDLAKCDYSDLSNIKCSLVEDAKWSNGEKITADDVISTFKIIKDKQEKLNKIEYNYLKDTKIFKTQDGTIVFRPEKKEINFLTSVLFQPIVSEKTLNSIGEKELFGKFDLENEIFSGEYVFDGVVETENTNIIKMKLKKNPYYEGEESYISNYIFKFSNDPKTLISNVNIFDNKDGIISNLKARFNKNPYFLPSYLVLFVNADKIIDEKLRGFILSQINRENIIKEVSKIKKVKSVDNPYFIDGYSLENQDVNFDLEKALKNLGYVKKQDLLQKYLEKELDKKDDKKEITSSGTLDLQNLKYVISDKINKNVNFLSQEAVIEGKLNGETPKEVIINHNGRDIKLNSLAKNNYKKFYFALRPDYNTLVEGKNLYKIYFDDKKNLKESFYVFYNKDLKKLEEYRKQAKNLLAKKDKEVEDKQKQDLQKNQEFLEKIKNLDEKFYYDKDLNPFSLKLYYIEGKDNNIVVENIEKNLSDNGIKLQAIPLSLKQLIKKISSGEKDYDLILTSVNLGYFKFNISRYFFSGASKNGFNFSNIRSAKLDTLLEELNSHIYTEKEQKQRQYKVLEILKEKQVVKTLYSIRNTQLVDKIVKNYELPEEIPSYTVVSGLLKNVYTKSEKQINWEKKSFSGYINFLKKILFTKQES